MSTMAPEAADAALDAGLIQALSGMGVADPKAAADCIRTANPDLTLETLAGAGGAPPAAFMKALINCATDEMATQAAASMQDVEGVTQEQKVCVAKAIMTYMGAQDDAKLTELLATESSNMPEDAKKEVIAGAKDCGISDELIEKALNS